MNIKQAWITARPTGLVSLSIESTETKLEKRIQCREAVFSAVPTPKNPLRHTLVMSLLTHEDLITIRDTINNYLQESE